MSACQTVDYPFRKAQKHLAQHHCTMFLFSVPVSPTYGWRLQLCLSMRRNITTSFVPLPFPIGEVQPTNKTHHAVRDGVLCYHPLITSCIRCLCSAVRPAPRVGSGMVTTYTRDCSFIPCGTWRVIQGITPDIVSHIRCAAAHCNRAGCLTSLWGVQVFWEQGATMGGSSGSPLIDVATRRVVRAELRTVATV